MSAQLRVHFIAVAGFALALATWPQQVAVAQPPGAAPAGEEPGDDRLPRAEPPARPGEPPAVRGGDERRPGADRVDRPRDFERRRDPLGNEGRPRPGPAPGRGGGPDMRPDPGFGGFRGGYPGAGPGGGAPFGPPGMMGMSVADPEMLELEQSESQHAARADELAVRYRQAGGEERDELRQQLRTAIQEHFEIRQKKRLLQLRRIEEEVKRLRDAISKREASREAIIDRRFAELVGEETEPGF